MKAKLLINSAVGNESFEYDLNKPEIKIGRSPQSNDIVLIDVQISREHAIIRTQGEEFTLVDLQSANGSFVNGNRITGECRMTEEDSIQIGKYILKLKLEEEIKLPPNMPMGKP